MFDIRPIAHIENDFETKFALPRQAGLIAEIKGTIVFEPEYASPDALRGLEEYSHLWLLWIFTENIRDGEAFQPTVRPPVLGGNVRKGVFATRSPFRPNHIGLSVVKLEGIELQSARGPLIHVSGADLVSGTPVIDIKPYIPDWDSYPEAWSGFGGRCEPHSKGEADRLRLTVVWSEEAYRYYRDHLSKESFDTLLKVLENDPRPAYQKDPDRVYGFRYAGLDVKFKVANDRIYPQISDDIL